MAIKSPAAALRVLRMRYAERVEALEQKAPPG